MLRRTLRRAVPGPVETSVRQELPVGSLVHYVGRSVPLSFADDAAAWLTDHEEAQVTRASRGALLRAVNEEALAKASDLLREVYGADIEILAPRVCYIEGARLLEPIMHFRVRSAHAHAALVKRQLAHRAAAIFDEEDGNERYLVRGTGPLAGLLGLGDVLLAATAGDAEYWSWLSHYAPVGPDGDQAA